MNGCFIAGIHLSHHINPMKIDERRFNTQIISFSGMEIALVGRRNAIKLALCQFYDAYATFGGTRSPLYASTCVRNFIPQAFHEAFLVFAFCETKKKCFMDFPSAFIAGKARFGNT